MDRRLHCSVASAVFLLDEMRTSYPLGEAFEEPAKRPRRRSVAAVIG